MSNYSFLSEVMRTQYWMMDPVALHHFKGIFTTARYDLEALGDVRWGERRAEGSLLVFKPGQAEPEERLIQTSHPNWYPPEEESANNQIIHVMPIKGAITHGGAECSYGTRELADRFLYADLQGNVVGHLVILDTPGGSAVANDLDEVFSNARKPVVALIRGMNASKGVWISSFIPHVFAERPDVEIGCVGVMAVLQGTRNGINTFNEVYYEVYADNSSMKNNEYREAIQNDNTAPTVEWLNKMETEFRSVVKRRWPNVPDEKLTGRMYKATDVVGELVDGIKSYNESVNYIFELAGVDRKFEGRVTTLGTIKEPAETTQPATGTEEPEQLFNNNPQTLIIPMKKEVLEAIPGMGAVSVDEKGNPVLTEEQSGILEAHLANTQSALSAQEAQQKEIADLKKQIQEKEQSIKELADATGKGITQPAPSNDNVVEQASAEIDGPIVSGRKGNYANDMKTLRGVLVSNGFINE